MEREYRWCFRPNVYYHIVSSNSLETSLYNFSFVLLLMFLNIYSSYHLSTKLGGVVDSDDCRRAPTSTPVPPC